MVLCIETQQNGPLLHLLQSTLKKFPRRTFAKHFREVQGHQRNMVLNRTFDVPYSGRRRPKQDALLFSVKMQIGGSGFRLKSFVCNDCLRRNISKSTCHCILSKSNSKHLIKIIYVRLENPTQLCVTWMKKAISFFT